MDREKALDKIKKCFALSKSSNPGEAANALRQAQKMMTMYSISETDMAIVGFGSEKVSLPVQANKSVPAYLTELSHLIKTAFGVRAVVEREIRVSDASYAWRFFGPMDRVPLAAYSFEVIFREANKAWAEHLRGHPRLKGVKGARSGFLIGWFQAVQETVTELVMTESEIKATERVRLEYYGEGALKKSKAGSGTFLTSTKQAGAEAGSEFRLHRPLTPQRLKISNS